MVPLAKASFSGCWSGTGAFTRRVVENVTAEQLMRHIKEHTRPITDKRIVAELVPIPLIEVSESCPSSFGPLPLDLFIQSADALIEAANLRDDDFYLKACDLAEGFHRQHAL